MRTNARKFRLVFTPLTLMALLVALLVALPASAQRFEGDPDYGDIEGTADGLGRVSSAGPGGVADHVVISELQTRGTTSVYDEFIELYNPLSSPVDLTGWRLSRKTAGGSHYNLLTTFPTSTIPAHGYFLIAHPSVYTDTRDAIYSTAQAIADNNTAVLYDAVLTVVDMVGMGSATISETATISNPVAGGSIERKAQSTSTSDTMKSGGRDEFRGNGYDSDDNSQDFVLQDSPEPQNSSSSTEIPFGPPMTVTVRANPTTIPADGTSTATITATVSDTVGYVADGTVVTFTTDLGSFPSDPYTNTTASGVATATLTSEKTADTAHVTATADAASDWVDVIFTEVYRLFMPLIVKNFTVL